MIPAPRALLALFDVGGPEILLIMLVTLLLFGSKRMPDLARGLGKSIREFKKATSGLEEELKRAMEVPPESPYPRQPPHPMATLPPAQVIPPAPPAGGQAPAPPPDTGASAPPSDDPRNP